MEEHDGLTLPPDEEALDDLLPEPEPAPEPPSETVTSETAALLETLGERLGRAEALLDDIPTHTAELEGRVDAATGRIGETTDALRQEMASRFDALERAFRDHQHEAPAEPEPELAPGLDAEPAPGGADIGPQTPPAPQQRPERRSRLHRYR